MIPKKLLQGQTARLVLKMDPTPWYYRFIQGAPAISQLKVATLEFVGFKSVESKIIGPVISSKKEAREQWIDEVSKLGYGTN